MTTTNTTAVNIYSWDALNVFSKIKTLTFTSIHSSIKMTPDASLVVLSDQNKVSYFKYNIVSNTSSDIKTLSSTVNTLTCGCPNVSGTAIYAVGGTILYKFIIDPASSNFIELAFSVNAGSGMRLHSCEVNSDENLIILSTGGYYPYDTSFGAKYYTGSFININIGLTDISPLTTVPLDMASNWRYLRCTLSYDNRTLYHCATDYIVTNIYSTPINYSGGFQIL